MYDKNGFYIAIGTQGSGKTALITMLTITEHQKHNDRKIFSNYNLEIPHEKITLKDIITMLDDDPNILNNSIILLDEIHLYLDSLDFMRKNNRKLQTFFSQLRKRNILLFGTTQYIMHVDIRIRRHLKMVYDMTNLKGGLFNILISEIDGYYTNPIKNIQMDLKKAFKYYDTNEIIID